MRVIKAHLRREYANELPDTANMRNKFFIEGLFRKGTIDQGQYGDLMKYEYKLYKERKEVA